MWCRTWYDAALGQTRRASLGTEDLSEAELRLAKWVAENIVEKRVVPAKIPLTTLLLRHYERVAKTQQSGAQAKIAFAYWTEFWGAAMVSDLTTDRQEEFVAWLGSKGHSDSYINRTLACGRTAIKRALDKNEIVSAPRIVQAAPQGRIKDMATPKGRPMSIAQTAALFDAITLPHLWTFCILAATTLGRPKAILEVDVSQYEQDYQLLHLNPTGRAQTKKFRPTIPVCTTLRPLLESVKQGPLVTYRGKPVSSVRSAFRSACRRAGLPDDIEPYSFRHTLGREMRRRKVPADELSIMLGHIPKDSSRTSEIYAPYEPDYCRFAAAAIDAFLDAVRAASTRKLARPESNKRQAVRRTSTRQVDPVH